ncbi:hypothetical protein COLO4_23864 [Corchorus olitorius]|uniref:Uncharacterized protein n=1 Tax=Corchorus olitorius TaxID=93759 RepID=A0A1R3IED1_9ROSI|nr:hypothetical protein COLO4_23864 [Corchorus olitorius]
MAKMPKVFSMSVGGQNNIGVTSNASGAKNCQNSEGVKS